MQNRPRRQLSDGEPGSSLLETRLPTRALHAGVICPCHARCWRNPVAKTDVCSWDIASLPSCEMEFSDLWDITDDNNASPRFALPQWYGLLRAAVNGPSVSTHGSYQRRDDDPVAAGRRVAALERSGTRGRMHPRCNALAGSVGRLVARIDPRKIWTDGGSVSWRGDADIRSLRAHLHHRGPRHRSARRLACARLRGRQSQRFGRTTLGIDGNFTVTGPLETFANAGGVHVARALLAEFSSNMARVVAERQAASAARGAPGSEAAFSATIDTVSVAKSAASTLSPSIPTPSSPRAAAELSATKILWSAFVSWFRSLISKGTKS